MLPIKSKLQIDDVFMHEFVNILQISSNCYFLFLFQFDMVIKEKVTLA